MLAFAVSNPAGFAGAVVGAFILLLISTRDDPGLRRVVLGLVVIIALGAFAEWTLA